MDKIIWQLGADSSQVRTEMANAAKTGQQGAQNIADSFGKAEGAHERLLRSSHRVSRQISNVSKDLLSGASAGDVFAASLEGIGRSLNLSLTMLAGLGVGAVVIQKIVAAREAYEKLKEELKAVHEEANKSGDFKTLSAIEAQAKKAEEAVKKIQEAIDAREGKKGLFSQIGQIFSDISNNRAGGRRLDGSFVATEEDQGALAEKYADSDKLIRQEIEKRQQQSGLKELGLSGTPSYALKAAEVLIKLQENAGKTLDEAAQSFREASIALAEIAKAQNDKKMERSGMSLKEMANAVPDVVNFSVPYEKWKASQDAKRAMNLDAQGETARMNMEPEQAHNLFNAAGEAKESITGLKPSEKMSADFKGALKVTEDELRQIAENTKGRLVNK